MQVYIYYFISSQQTVIKIMLTFEQQEKIFAVILSRDSNRQCADCNSIHPTWASLDFGVFVCSNCSGSHRAMGPTVTRVKSTTLDRWHKDWVENVKIGNREINMYWEADSETANIKKPKIGATLEQHNRFINDKYRRRKFVKDTSASDPLTSYKNGTYKQMTSPESVSSIVPEPPKSRQYSTTQNTMPVPPKPIQHHTKSQAFSLLDDLDGEDIVARGTNKATQEDISNKEEPDDQFSDFVEAEYQPKEQSNQQSEQKVLTFQQLMKAPQLTTHQSHQPMTSQLSNNYQQKQNNSQIHNSFANQSQSLYNQYHHNPYVGYVPHYNNPHNGMQSTGYNQQQMGFHNSQYQQGFGYQSSNGPRPNSYQPVMQNYQCHSSQNIQGFTLN